MTDHVQHGEKERADRWHPCYASLREWLDSEAPEMEPPTPARTRKQRLVRVRRA